ncbi:Pro-epidermal growth factor [Trichoplax sp. H2]|nr:Pro-epidermal growth factor [Trichoplax sp. H2]|eukprot:RDD42001.1 Pro-epidermal growth factor [Trichoplax sp. H2]
MCSIATDFYIVFKENSKINPSELANVISTNNLIIQGQSIQNVTITDFNECARATDNTCNSNQNCINLYGTYTCQCKIGFTGSGCVDINERTTTEPCANKTVCSNTEGSYTCTCRIGYQGDPYSTSGCSVSCSTNYCLNGGTCTYENSGHIYICDKAYTGTICETRWKPDFRNGKLLVLL